MDQGLPSLYSTWITQLLGRPVPQESKATCSSCAMCRSKDNWQTASNRYFDEKLKCCTYMPELPNFLAGMILADESESMRHGRAELCKQLDSKLNVTPLGIGPPPSYSALNDRHSQGFGNDPDLLCPYYQTDGDLCSIWMYRNSRCATWFCKFDRGAIGMNFWKRMEELLTALERALAFWCIQKMEVTEQEWGTWCGREADFYKQCSQLVRALSLEEVMEIGGTKAYLLSHQVAFAYGSLGWFPIPARLKIGTFQKIEEGLDRFRIWTYSKYDPIELTRSEMEMLRHFDSRTTQEVCFAGGSVDEQLIRKWIDYAILVPA